MSIACTLLHHFSTGCSRGRILDVDLPALPPLYSMLRGFLDPPGTRPALLTLHLRVEGLELQRDGRVLVTVSLPGRPASGVPTTLWTAAGWRTEGCG